MTGDVSPVAMCDVYFILDQVGRQVAGYTGRILFFEGEHDSLPFPPSNDWLVVLQVEDKQL